MEAIGVMHLIDTLQQGGAERTAVNLANALPQERYRVFLCTTRAEGPLDSAVQPTVGRLRLNRRYKLDVAELWRLVSFIRQNKIRVLHAHSTSLFTAVLASLFPPFPKVIWHAHSGRAAVEDRQNRYYRWATQQLSAALGANNEIVEWIRRRFALDPDRVVYLPNIACFSEAEGPPAALPGAPEGRIVCVANFRPEKDHVTLISAFELVAAAFPPATLLLVGSASDPKQVSLLRDKVKSANLQGRVAFLGERRDIRQILSSCAIGVLSSRSEGLPVALLEYGLAGLPVVATSVGQCSEVLAWGRAGLIVEPNAPDRLAEALLRLLSDAELRRSLSVRFSQEVKRYHPKTVAQLLTQVYDQVLKA